MKKTLTTIALALATLLAAPAAAQAATVSHPHYHVAPGSGKGPVCRTWRGKTTCGSHHKPSPAHHKPAGNPCYTHPRPDWAASWSQAEWIGYCNMADPALWH